MQVARLGEVERIFDKIAERQNQEMRVGRVLVDRRKSERRSCHGAAKIQLGVGSLPRDCTITDISDGGVRVIAENLDVPAEFTLILSTGRPRLCRLAWRIGCEFGAQFIDHLATAPLQRSAPHNGTRTPEYA
ncbi:PilZ domain-containing protein [Bradyrhizobium sp. CB3481]|nr:PilZ domain-containing protein [Bradyrhizobium sp. CB3481]WFU18769.1 PilZ domain-containing protein [Bradyrhizobium sp. CB3481]